jgi:N-acetylneuraminic acid mutarotase
LAGKYLIVQSLGKITVSGTISRRAILTAPLLLQFASSTPEPSGWQRCSDMPVKRSETLAVASNGAIYLAGGFDAGTAAHRYNPTTDSWDVLTPLPSAVNHPGLAVFEGNVTLCGGYGADGMTAFDAMLAYNATANQWDQIGQLPQAIGAFGLASVGEDLYIAGGAFNMLGGTATSQVWKRTGKSTEWIACSPLAVAREHLTLVACDSELFAIGGRAAGTDENATGAIVERWRPGDQAWERLADLPRPRSGLAGTGRQSGIVVAGGETSKSTFDAVDLYNPAANTWTKLPSLPVPVHGMGLAALDDVLYAFGGSAIAGQIASVSSVWKLASDVSAIKPRATP